MRSDDQADDGGAVGGEPVSSLQQSGCKAEHCFSGAGNQGISRAAAARCEEAEVSGLSKNPRARGYSKMGGGEGREGGLDLGLSLQRLSTVGIEYGLAVWRCFQQRSRWEGFADLEEDLHGLSLQLRPRHPRGGRE